MGSLANAIGVLGVLSTAAEAIPVFGSNLKVAAELAAKICETIQSIKGNREGYEDLALHVEQLLVAVASALQKARPERLGAMTANVKRLIRVLEEIQVGINDRTRSDTPSPVGTCDRLSTWICNAATDVTRVAADEDNVKKMRQKLDQVVVEFDVGTLMRTEIRVENVETLVRLAVENISRLHAQVQAIDDRDRLEEESRFNAKRVAENSLLDTLNPVSSATWDAGAIEAAVCTPETRVGVLDEILSWVDDPAGSCVFWLNGLAGTGKSTIARTICQRLSERALLGANFFISRQHQERRKASNIVHTLAHQLALHERATAGALCAVLRERPTSASRSLETEIRDFIGKPAGTLAGTSSWVIVLDALDECLPESSLARPGGDLLVFLVRQLMGLSGRLKLFITSRTEPSIQQMFDALSTHLQHTAIKLHDLDQTMVEQDIRTYLLGAFKQICVRRTTLNLYDWPLAEDLERLVQDSGLLFVYASIVIRFVDNPQHSPRDRLAQVLGHQQAGVLAKPYTVLDRLYRQILTDAVMSSDEDEDEDETCDALCRRIRDVLAVVVLVQTPLHVDAVAVLADQGRDDAHIALQSLSALLLVDTGEPVRIFHPSFSEFLTDSKRCADTRIFVEPAKHHANLALRCLLLMNKYLRYDICNIGDPTLANADVADLKTRLRDRVSDALQYACSFWPVHLMALGVSDQDAKLRDVLAEFSSKHIFHWLEVLSLLQRLPMAEVQLLETIQWYEKLPTGRNMIVATRLLQDTVRVLQEYRMPLRSHALHAYHSAYVTMPQCLLLDTLQQQSLPRSLPSMTSPRELHWGPWNRAIEGHESEVLCVAVSPDGRRIASGSRDGTVRVWGTTTLEEIARLTPEDKCYISCIAFSPDGARFATCSMAGFIYIWNFDTLEQLAILELNRDTSVPVWQNIRDHVTCYALFSNNGNLTVAAAGGDLCIWSANTFEELGNFKGYAPLALSLDDSRIVACRSRTMIDAALYDAIAFEELVRLEPFAGRILATAFSPDGLHIVFYLNDNSLKVWNAATSEVIESFEGPKYGFVNAVTFSPCGTRMVSAHSDRMLRLWDAAGYKELATFKGHEGSISAVAFSPEGTQLVSGSEDKTVRIWSAIDLEGSIKLENDRLRQTWARSIAFLPCGARIISRVGDEPVRIWDAETSKELGELQNVPNDSRATIIVWSPDGSLITANYGGRHSLLVWNTRTFEMVAELERGFDANTSFSCAAFSRDSKCIVSGMRNGVILVWSTLNSEVVVELKSLDSRATCVAYSPDGSYIAAGGELTLRVWNAVTYEELYLHHSSKHASSLEFSHDGARLMVLFRVDTEGNRGNTCVIWSMDTFHAIAEFESEDYRPATFTADGKGVLFFDLDSDGNAITSAWMPSQVDSTTWSEVPLSAVTLPPTNATTYFGTKFRLGMDLSQTGWLSCWIDSTMRLIWLPYDRRNWDKAMGGRRVAIAGEHRHGAAALTLLKFPGPEGERQSVLES